RERLESAGMTTFLRTSGGKGLHVVLPIDRRTTWDDFKAFAKSVADTMTREAPDRYIATISKAKRRGKIFIDFLRNQRGATAIAPYSTRARPGAFVALPVSWAALGHADSAHPASVADAAKKIARADDPWPDYFRLKQALPLGTKS